MMAAFMQAVEYWHWLVLAMLLLVLEALVPGAVFLWAGVAAVVVGLVMLAVPIDWQLQLVIFAVLSVASIVLWRRYQKAHPTVSASPLLNRRTQRYVGRHVVITTAVSNGSGAAKLGDTVWSVEGADMSVGAKAEVTGARGSVLLVKPLESD